MKKKPLFKNYVFEFDSNEKKIISNFCKQAVQQMQGSSEYQNQVKAFNEILDKLHSKEEKIKFTKNEKYLLTKQLEENVKYIDEKMKSTWFLQRWLMKSLKKQYEIILNTHFND